MLNEFTDYISGKTHEVPTSHIPVNSKAHHGKSHVQHSRHGFSDTIPKIKYKRYVGANTPERAIKSSGDKNVNL